MPVSKRLSLLLTLKCYELEASATLTCLAMVHEGVAKTFWKGCYAQLSSTCNGIPNQYLFLK